MGDPLSIAASVAGLITISAHVVGIAKELFGKVKDAPETMMQVREEVESMQPIFNQVQLLLNGSGKGVNHANLTMISIHNLMATLTGCVIVYDKLEKKVNEVCGFNDPATDSALWKSAGIIADRVKWGLWRQEEVMCIIEDLQRQKRSLNLMLTIITCTTTTEASARLQELYIENLQSSHAHSVLLRDLISRQDVVLNRQDEQARILDEIRSHTSILASTGSSSAGSNPSSAGDNPSYGGDNLSYGSGNRDNSDNASIMSKRSTFSLRLVPPSYMKDLKASRAYKRLRHFGREIESSSESVFSLGSCCSTGNWSMLSDITLGDLSVSQIAVLNLPIDLSDVSNPESFQDRLSMETPRSPKSRSKRSSRGRMHNAIENGNVFVVRTLLAIGVDMEELDSSGRTPLVHAAVKHQEAICNLLLEKGASVEALKAFTSGMDFTKALQAFTSGMTSAELLHTSAISMHDLVEKGYKSTLVLLSLAESCDPEGWTPLASAAFNNNEALCALLIEKGCSLCLDTEQKKQLIPKLSCRIHVAAVGGNKIALQLLLDMGADINERNSDANDKTALLEAVSNNHLSCVKLLIERGADAMISSNSQRTVLHRAAWAGHEQIMKFLLDDVVETRTLVNAKDNTGKTALDDCSYINRRPAAAIEIAKMLLQAGATLSFKCSAEQILYEHARSRREKELAKYLWSQLSPEQRAHEKPPRSDW